MSLLPCDSDLVALRLLVDGRYWDLDALRHHVSGCRRCQCIRRALAATTGSQGGMAGRGASKRRGGSDYYRALAARQTRNALR